MKEIYGRNSSGESFSGNARQASALAAYGHVEAFVALLAEFGNRNVFSNLHTGHYVNSDLFHNVDFGSDDIFLKFV